MGIAVCLRMPKPKIELSSFNSAPSLSPNHRNAWAFIRRRRLRRQSDIVGLGLVMTISSLAIGHGSADRPKCERQGSNSGRYPDACDDCGRMLALLCP
ncbi:hypothetical protein OH77DRAFT_1418575 [Trametes cingulata]|nr:hypothetical protein OH77DRAFT_1418575 [Trametes cingulata]